MWVSNTRSASAPGFTATRRLPSRARAAKGAGLLRWPHPHGGPSTPVRPATTRPRQGRWLLVAGARVTSRSTSLLLLLLPRLIEPNTRTSVTPLLLARASSSTRWASIKAWMSITVAKPSRQAVTGSQGRARKPDGTAGVRTPPKRRSPKLAAFCAPPTSRPTPAVPAPASVAPARWRPHRRGAQPRQTTHWACRR